MNTIPLMDLKRQYESIKSEIDPVIQDCLSKAAFIGGPAKEKFEQAFAQTLNAKHCIGVGNGTDSLTIILKALRLMPGDEVLVPANSFIASSEAVTNSGAFPVFVDIDRLTYNMDLDAAEKILSTRAHSRGGRIKAIIPVHLYGRAMDMTRVKELAQKYHLKVVEDCAQAHLAKWKGQFIGTWSDAASFSFYPGKNLGAYGDAGAIVSNDSEVAELARKIANHGRIGKYDHDMEGYNSRLDSLQAAVLSVKLKHLHQWTEKRKDLAHRYDQLLANIAEVIRPQLPPHEEHVFHLYVIRLQKRDEVAQKLKEKGIETGVHYPTSLPLLKAYSHHKMTAKDIPVSAQFQNEILSLPLFPEMTHQEQDFVVAELKSAIHRLN